MTALNQKTNDSELPSGYLQSLCQTYEENNVALKGPAKTPPADTSADGEALCLIEQGLLHNQS